MSNSNEDYHLAIDELIGQGIKTSNKNALDEIILARNANELIESDVIEKILKSRKNDLDKHYNNLFSTYTLKDFNWSLRLVLASDKLSNIKKPKVLLELSLIQLNQDVKQIQIELNKQEFKNLLDNCHKIYKVLNTLRSHD